MRAALDASDWALLARLCRQALRKQPRHHQAHRYLGVALHKLRRSDEALEAFKRAMVLWPDDAELLLNHSQTLMELARDLQALPLMERVCALRPDHYLVWLKYSQCCYRLQRHEQGYAAALRIESLAQTNEQKSAALMQKAIHRREFGQVKEAVQDCETAIRLDPAELTVHTNRLLFMLADPDVGAVDIRAAAGEYAAVVEAGFKNHWPHFNPADQQPWKRLKVGFLSPDFRNHSVMYFVEGLLAQLDRRQFEVVALHLHPGGDLVTDRVKRHADQFIDLTGLSHGAQVARLWAERFDILVDLAGHTGNNGLLLMARKLAPLQVSWLGYPATTGLTAMDYKFTDEVTDPVGAEHEYSEKLYRMPTLFVAYRPMVRNPLWRYQPAYVVRPTPALTNGYVTFGSCNNLGKLTDDVLRLWGQVLATVPEARLLIEGKNLGDAAFAQSYRDRCERLGIPSERLELVGLDNRNQYLTYHRIDIALDPFPLTGGTTTFDLLWMGVPLVSMVGASFKSRMGTGILSYLGCAEWLADSPERYVAVAAALASDVAQLNQFRLSLRDVVEQSPLMDEAAFCRHFGDGLRNIWLEWMATGLHPNQPEDQHAWVLEVLSARPHGWDTPEEPGVGLEPGRRVPLSEAYRLLDQAIQKARLVPPQDNVSGLIDHKRWAEVTDLAEKLLCAVPNNPVALSSLAEVEEAHGHLDFAMTYLRQAQVSLARSAG